VQHLGVKPTIKIPVGYAFNVRVDRDILFEGPYEPMDVGDVQTAPVKKHVSSPASNDIAARETNQ
jgi:hypothetical protein